ncbi:hypothetical protein GCM10017786_44310 [Amycolatopsis deserti]|uniref:DUF4192 domain-containing protein n=1 Tax=Amycolatopsis deserti TaxID=185696 RepID=A0ABQ3J9N3_9PSEU|nr:DUF4192 domain-containing protein [Amycolatopsis deserti]GHF05909.1 hypothetical protein GCM10017786_44310 [Amycolatopsis deserti]
MTSTTTSTGTDGRITVRISDPGELIAAVPHLLSYRPGPSVVLLNHSRGRRRKIIPVIRADLPDETCEPDAARELVRCLLRHPGAAVTVLIVGCRPGHRAPPGALPHHRLAHRLVAGCEAAGRPVDHALWVPEIRGGAPWRCYHEDCRPGVLPDDRETVLAAAMATNGQVTFGSREELARQLDPDDPAAIERRERLLEAAADGWAACPTAPSTGGIAGPAAAVTGGVAVPDGPVTGGVAGPDAPVTGGVAEPQAAATGRVACPATPVTGGVAVPDAPVTGGVAEPDAPAADGVAVPDAPVTGGVACPAAPATGGVAVPDAPVTDSVACPPAAVTGGVAEPAAPATGRVAVPDAPATDGVAQPADGIAVVRAALARAVAGDFDLSDEDVVSLAMALSDLEVRDRCLTTAEPPGEPQAAAAERLWLELVRRTPPPERAEAAVLLGYAAYRRGDGVLASLAFDNALTAHPGHRLAELLRICLERQLPPDALRRLSQSQEGGLMPPPP